MGSYNLEKYWKFALVLENSLNFQIKTIVLEKSWKSAKYTLKTVFRDKAHFISESRFEYNRPLTGIFPLLFSAEYCNVKAMGDIV